MTSNPDEKISLTHPMGDERTADELSEEERQQAAAKLDPADLAATGGSTDMIGGAEDDEV